MFGVRGLGLGGGWGGPVGGLLPAQGWFSGKPVGFPVIQLVFWWIIKDFAYNLNSASSCLAWINNESWFCHLGLQRFTLRVHNKA